jgi:oxygen-independent coproporphyrinogen-3 oxidase
MVKINKDRLWERTMLIGGIGAAEKGGGCNRFSWTPAYREAAMVLMGWMKELDMTVRVDSVGNIFGKYHGTEELPGILTGSHLDTVPHGGKFDGLAGIMAGLEAISSIKDSGINRLSLGVQSFNEDELHILNRIHSSRDALQTVETLHSVGLTNFNIDLIYGIPGQTLSSWEKTLKTAVSCCPAHISIYLLQLSPVTPMATRITYGELSLLDEDTEANMYYYALDFLRAAGYEHYEISNLARPGYQCRHNLIYWEARPYIGLGAGAVSFQANRRIMNLANVEKYMESIENSNLPATELLEEMKPPDLPVDALILGLRLVSGINCMGFEQRYGINIIEVYHQQIDNCISAGLLKYENNVIALTEKGYFLSNQVLCRFLK